MPNRGRSRLKGGEEEGKEVRGKMIERGKKGKSRSRGAAIRGGNADQTEKEPASF